MNRLLAALVVTVLFVRPVFAEKVDLTPKQLHDTATHVVVGTVKGIYSREEPRGDYRVTHYVAEVAIKQCEKGDGLAKGGLVYARYWHQTWTAAGAAPPGTSGHRGLPTEGQTLRIYLARNAYDGFNPKNDDGGLNVIGANGFEALPAGGEK